MDLKNYLTIISKKRDKYIYKKDKLMDSRKDLGDKLISSTYDMLINQIEEIIDDLTSALQEMRSAESYHKKCSNLINNLKN